MEARLALMQKIEVLLLKRKKNDVWETLVKPGKKCKPGTVIISFGDGILTGEVIDVVEEGNRLIKFMKVFLKKCWISLENATSHHI